MPRNKIKQYLNPLVAFFKFNWKTLLLIEVMILITSFAGYSTLPFLRAINQTWGIIFAVIYTIFAILTFVLTNKVISKYFKNSTIVDKEDTIRFFYFFSTLIITGVIMTIAFIIIRAINPNTEYLIQGIVGIILLLVYYFLFGFVIYLDKFINYLKFKKENKQNKEEAKK